MSTAWIIRCGVTGKFLRDVSVVDESLTLTRCVDKALPFPSDTAARDCVRMLMEPVWWPDFAWRAEQMEG